MRSSHWRVPGWLALGLVLPPTLALADPPTPERQQALVHLVRHDCGSCHGLSLNGGLGPALTPEALRDRPPRVLIDSILRGRPGTAMPPWQGLLTEAEVSWIVERLREGLEK
ncbi:MAG: cytochrome c [Candidatus Competibacterales bacterium]|nr:cytochrome c [Candidatus Competibacterales bacterium]